MLVARAEAQKRAGGYRRVQHSWLESVGDFALDKSRDKRRC